jgi:hypothetical protein
MNFQETIFYITHPKFAIEAKLRQIGVGADLELPPSGTTLEEFPNLKVYQASALIHAAHKISSSGVQLEDWSESDQKRLLKGKKPKGVPILRNL